MSLSPAELWDRLRQRARQVLPEQTYRTWLEPTEALAVEGDTLMVGAPDQFSADWNESKHADLLSGFSPVALGHPLKVRFKVHEERVGRVQMDMFVQPPPAPVIAPSSQQQSRISTPLNPRYTFDQFVIGKSNDVAAAAAQAAAQAPGKVYNPLFIYGDTGLGKTHLMQGIAHELLRRTPTLRLAYVGTEQFTNEFVGAIQTGQMGDFRRRFREIDLLLVDDVQFLKGKEGTQEEFFHTFNAIYEAGRQIVLTSDRPPKEIPGLESRLVSRFEWGMVANIDSPDLEHRIAILRKKASLDHLELTIPDEVIEFIAQHVKSSVRELEGSIIKLLAYASLKHRDISVDLAREALRDKLRGSLVLGFPGRPAHHHHGRHHPAGRGARMGGHARWPAVEDPHQAADHAPPGGHVSLSRAAGPAAGRDRQRLRRSRPLHGHSLARSGGRGHGRRARIRRSRPEGSDDVGNPEDNRPAGHLSPQSLHSGPHRPHGVDVDTCGVRVRPDIECTSPGVAKVVRDT